MPSLSECPQELRLARTSGCDHAETIVISSLQQVARRANRNYCAIINDTSGRKLFFKHNLGGSFKYIVTDAERRRRDICNILASRILSDVFALHCVVYRDSFLVFPDGHRLRGVACDYLEESRWLQLVPWQDIMNQEEGIWQIVALTWLGDIDRLNNPGGDFVTQGGMYITLDFDFCFGDGVSVFGLPIANRSALKYFMQSGSVESTIARILRFTDVDIANMVERLGRDWVGDWSEDYQSSFVGVLIRNRERLRRSKALQKFDHKMSPCLQLVEYLVTRFYQKVIIPRKIMSIVRKQGMLSTTLRLFAIVSRTSRRDSDFYAGASSRTTLTATATGGS